MTHFSRSLALLFGLLLGLLPATASAQEAVVVEPVVPGVDVGADDESAAYRLGPGDLLEISVLGEPELSRTVRVDADGATSSIVDGGRSLCGCS